MLALLQQILTPHHKHSVLALWVPFGLILSLSPLLPLVLLPCLHVLSMFVTAKLHVATWGTMFKTLLILIHLLPPPTSSPYPSHRIPPFIQYDKYACRSIMGETVPLFNADILNCFASNGCCSIGVTFFRIHLADKLEKVFANGVLPFLTFFFYAAYIILC